VYAVCEIVAEEHRQHLKPSVALKLELSPFLPPIEADTLRLRQILGNLVSNAIKHTEQGEICIKASQHGPILEIAVRDTGAGIPEDQQAIIFVPFVRLNNRTAGVGLGLDIALQLARLHGGDIRLQSVVGQGSTFTVELPIKRTMLYDGDKARH
jgi:signal transduction histidine kinase